MKARLCAAAAAGAMVLTGFVMAAPSALATTAGDCSSGTYTWFHLYNQNAIPVYNELCIGGVGNYSPNTIWTAFCGGNNTGYIVGYNDDGTYERVDYGPSGGTYMGDSLSSSEVYKFSGNPSKFPGGTFQVTGVDISKWGGDDTCPQDN